MYIHIGADILVRASEIIVIIDKDSIASSDYMKALFMRQKNQMIDLANGSYKSLIVTTNHVYFSPLTSGTLKKRSYKLAVQEY
ncbi:extracellular matrix regulator RemB [Bacillus sp. 03113]|uniref:extracellular matrix regulator RemB n=1 Tax=Bacillus sp. 03113 TaxID=2578211 RepID=UPI0011431CBA|nr:extracellular matrix/biofilm biosynthesis regulator RemA family protein [Bacillus sp. 03113]